MSADASASLLARGTDAFIVSNVVHAELSPVGLKQRPNMILICVAIDRREQRSPVGSVKRPLEVDQGNQKLHRVAVRSNQGFPSGIEYRPPLSVTAMHVERVVNEVVDHPVHLIDPKHASQLKLGVVLLNQHEYGRSSQRTSK